jgi:hypothetical protein
MKIKSHFCVSANKLKNVKNMLAKLEETVCRMEGYRCIMVSKVYVTLQGHTPRGQLN